MLGKMFGAGKQAVCNEKEAGTKGTAEFFKALEAKTTSNTDENKEQANQHMGTGQHKHSGKNTHCHHRQLIYRKPQVTKGSVNRPVEGLGTWFVMHNLSC